MDRIWNNWTFVLLSCLTLGLAPFVPEPHIVGKMRWILGGARGMGMLDWLDFVWHGVPWMLLCRLIWLAIVRRSTDKPPYP